MHVETPIFVTPKRVSTGTAELDEVLKGGLPKDRLYLLEGAPGTGKTTVALKFLLEGVRLGERVLYVTLSETGEELNEVAASHGWSLDGVTIYELSAIEQELAAEAQNTLFHPSDIELSQTTEFLFAKISDTHPTRLVLDSLSEYRLLAQSPLRFRRQLLALKQYFINKACTVLILDDMTSGDPDLQIESIAHGVIKLEHVPNEYGASRRRLMIRKLRGVNFKSGYHDYAILEGGIAVYPRLTAAEMRDQKDDGVVVSSGIKGLDDLLGGGLDQGTSTLLVGPSGSGKSTVAIQYMVSEARKGNPSVLFTFDETVGVTRKRAKSVGLDIDPYLEKGLVRVTQIDPAELSPGEFAHRLKDVVEKDGIRLVVVDSLNGYLNAMPGERHLSIQLHEILSYLNQRGVLTILLLAQHGLFGQMRSSVDLTYLCDTLVLFRNFEMRGRIKRAISIIKKRTGFHEESIRELYIGKGIRVGRPLEEFQGILTGVPSYVGDASKMLMDSDESIEK